MKSAKRLLRANISPSGSLDSDNFLRALLQLRNTPDPDCRVSPAQIVFGHPLRDAFSFVNRLEKFSNENISWLWRSAWESKEAALRTRFVKSAETMNRNSRHLPQLSPGERCFVQNQTGNSPKRWDRTGIVMESKPHDQYVIKIDGSGRLTTRNRRFLRHFEPASMNIQRAPPLNMSYTPTDSHPLDTQDDQTQQNEQAAPYVTDNTLPVDTPELHETENMESNDEQKGITTDGATNNKPVALALKRLMPHNNQGLLEDKQADVGGRRLRSSRH